MNEKRKPTNFEMRVYQATKEIPLGKVTSYRELAQKIHCGSARAVGSALAKNPFAPEVPCHRVVRSDGTLGGFNGETAGEQLDHKLQLLRTEGVTIAQNGRVPKEAFWQFP